MAAGTPVAFGGLYELKQYGQEQEVPVTVLCAPGEGPHGTIIIVTRQ